MFEDSFVTNRVHTAAGPLGWLKLASFLLQLSLLTAWLSLPLLHPERLQLTPSPLHTLPPLHLVRPAPRVVQATTAHAAPASPSLPRSPSLAAPAIHATPAVADAAPTLSLLSPNAFAAANSLPASILGSTPRTPAVGVGSGEPTKTRAPLHLSSGVSAGLLLSPIRPIYPHIAIITRTEGTVVVEAVISKQGRIEAAHILSGPELLRNSALAAVQTAHYKPYVLNGEAVAVETHITVTYRLGASN